MVALKGNSRTSQQSEADKAAVVPELELSRLSLPADPWFAEDSGHFAFFLKKKQTVPHICRFSHNKNKLWSVTLGLTGLSRSLSRPVAG